MSISNGSTKAKDNKITPGKEEVSIDENNDTADMLSQSREGETNPKNPDVDQPEENEETTSRDAQLKKHMTELMESGPGVTFDVVVMLLTLLSSLAFVGFTYVDSAQWDVDCCAAWFDKSEEY